MKFIHSASLGLLALVVGSIATPKPEAAIIVETVIHDQSNSMMLKYASQAKRDYLAGCTTRRYIALLQHMMRRMFPVLH